MAKNARDLVPLTIHPRAIFTLGHDLVTDDSIAIIELVKNSYDAFATKVEVVFETNDTDGTESLMIIDDGHGMDYETILHSWCVVATPTKINTTIVSRGKMKREVSGNKGIGRLATARLGRQVEIITKTQESSHRIEMNWDTIEESTKADEQSYVGISELSGKSKLSSQTGTLIRISRLNKSWKAEEFEQLKEELGRVVSPFGEVGKFKIRFSTPTADSKSNTELIESSQFLSSPPYMIRGHFDDEDRVIWKFEYRQPNGNKRSSVSGNISWEQIVKVKRLAASGITKAECGPFSFEIRAWDLTKESPTDISTEFNVKRSTIRSALRAHKGISVYRDGILVLPKTESSRDWLGLDTRAISRVGSRLRTQNILGYVSIGAKSNPHLKDTSDRERLTENTASIVFQEVLFKILSQLENLRSNEQQLRKEETNQQNGNTEDPDEDEFLEELEESLDKGNTIETLRIAQEHAEQVSALKAKMVTYSRLATLGTLAEMLIHEIRNRTTIIARFLRIIKIRTPELTEKEELSREKAEISVSNLEVLADSFAPLASTKSRARKNSNLDKSISNVLNLLDSEISQADVEVTVHNCNFDLSVDPGELHSVIHNLISNSVYWLKSLKKDSERFISVRAKKVTRQDRVIIEVADNGPGIKDADMDKIFLPGFSLKPDGYGMGLTVVSELVAKYEGELGVHQNTPLSGVTFSFDLPTRKSR